MPTKLAMARAPYKDETHSIKDIYTSLCISGSTLYHYLDTLGEAMTAIRSTANDDK